MSRFFILEAGQMALPAKCHSCGSCDTDRKYIDIILQVEFYGSVYICTLCMVSVAQQIGYVPEIAVQYLEEQLERAQSRIKELEDNDGKLRTVLELFSGRDLIAEHSRLSTVPDSEESPIESGSGEVIPTNGKGSRKSRSNKGSDSVLPAAADPVDGADGEDANAYFSDPE